MTTQRHMSTGLDRKRCIQTGLLSYSDSPTHPGNSLFHKHIQNLTGIHRRARPRQTGPLSPLELKKFSKPSAPKVSRDPFKHRSTQNSPISSQVTMAKVKLLPPRRRAPQPRLPARLLASLLGSLINSLSFATLVSWRSCSGLALACALPGMIFLKMPASVGHAPCFSSNTTLSQHSSPTSYKYMIGFLCRVLITIQYGSIWLFTTYSDTTRGRV